MSEQPVSERIKILLMEYAHGNKAHMGRSLGISGQAIADLVEGKKGGPSFPVLQKMLTLYPDIRAEWLVLGEEPMRKSKVSLMPNKVSVASKNIIIEGEAARSVSSDPIDVSLTSEQVTQIFQAAYTSFISSTEVKEHAATIRAEAQAEADLLTSIYWIGEPDPTRPYKGLLTERLGISEDEARALILNEEIQARYIGFGKQRRINNYRISERAIRKFLDGMNAEQQRAEMNR